MAPVVEPIARALLRIGLTADMVTLIGAAITVTTALCVHPARTSSSRRSSSCCFPRRRRPRRHDGAAVGHAGALWRLAGRHAGPRGRRRGLRGLLWWAVRVHEDTATIIFAWIVLVGAVTISYAKARAEAVGATANGGIAERAERFIVVGIGGLLYVFGLDWAMTAALAHPRGARRDHRVPAGDGRAQPAQAAVRAGEPRRRRAGAERLMITQQASYLAYAGGWQAVRLMPEPAAYAMFRGDRRPAVAAAARRRCAGWRRNLAPRDARAVARAELREASRPGCAPTCATGATPSGCPAGAPSRSAVPDHERAAAGDRSTPGGASCWRCPTRATGTTPGPTCRSASRPVNTVAEKLEPKQLFESFVAFRETRDDDPRPGGPRRLRPAWPTSGRRRWSRCWPTGTCRPRAST